MDECIIDLFGPEWRKRTGLRAAVVADKFLQKFPETVRDYGTALMFNHLVTIASGRLRAGTALLRVADARVFFLPGLDDSILANLPPLITVPSKDGEVHKPITHAKVFEVRIYCNLLFEQMKNDERHYRAILFLVELVKGRDGDEDLREACAAAMREPAL